MNDLYDGGYRDATDDYILELADQDVWWSVSDYIHFDYSSGDEAPLPTIESVESREMLTVSGHDNDDYNGDYYRMEDWNE